MPEQMTPEQYAQLIEKNKPHLVRIEEEVERVSDGQLDIRVDVRQGVVNKITFIDSRVWFRPKT